MRAQWTEGQYGCYYLMISKEVYVSLCWDGGTKPKGHDATQDGYKISFLGHTMKGRPQDLDKAKEMAVQFACIVLNQALEAIQ